MTRPTVVDLTQPVRPGMGVFPGDPEVDFAAAGEAPWAVTRLLLGSHSGTHIDAPAHIVPGGRTIDQYPPERFILRAWPVSVVGTPSREIAWEQIAAQLPQRLDGGAVLLHTGWDRHLGEPEAVLHPYLGLEAARGLVSRGAGLVGTDALNVDDSSLGGTQIHETLLSVDVLIVENLCGLEALRPEEVYLCSLVPLRLEGADGSPIRAYAYQDDTLPTPAQE
jgi:arylformamidase